MGLLNFVNTFEQLASNFIGNQEQHHRFEIDAQQIVDTIVAKLKKNDSVFQGFLGQLRNSGKRTTLHKFDI